VNFWPVTLPFKFDLDMVKMNQQANIWVKGHIIQKLLSRHTHTHTHTHWTKCYICTTNYCRELYDWEHSRQAAQDNYRATSSQMHPVTSAMLAKDLHLVWSHCVVSWHIIYRNCVIAVLMFYSLLKSYGVQISVYEDSLGRNVYSWVIDEIQSK